MTAWLRQFCFYVSDIDATIKFYETIGLTCTAKTQISEDIVEAMIENPEKGGILQLAQNKTVTGDAPINMGTAMWKLYVYTDDCQGYYDKAMAAGYKSQSPPRRSPQWPAVEIAFIYDPDGYVVEFVQRDVVPTAPNVGGSPRNQTLTTAA